MLSRGGFAQTSEKATASHESVGDRSGLSGTFYKAKTCKNQLRVCLKMSCTQKNPMVLLIIIPIINGYENGNIHPIFRQTQFPCGTITRVMAGIDKEQDVDVGQNGRPMWDHRCESLV